jgi:hypothetical protein
MGASQTQKRQLPVSGTEFEQDVQSHFSGQNPKDGFANPMLGFGEHRKRSG